MTLSSPMAQTKLLPPSYQHWDPEPFQLRGAEHLKAAGAAVLWLDPGFRKTSIVLKAFCDLQAAGSARKMLVVAPRKVCQLVWRQEAAKWDVFRHLKITFLHGPKKGKLLHDDADIHLINPEAVLWLAKQYALNPNAWPYDTVTFDELTKFKNSQSERSKALRGRSVGGRMLPNLLKRSQRRWGMTGTPNPNGYTDLFGQFLLLDDGAALGRFFTHYRDTYFSGGFNGFDYALQPGGAKRIQARLRPYVFALDAGDYIKLPELQDNLIDIALEPEAWAAYEKMRKGLVVDLDGTTLEAANKAVSYSKLSQMAGGAVYMADGSVVEIHDAKLDALSDLMDEMGDRQLLIAYEFNHEMDRLKARHGNRIQFLSDAKTDRAAEQVQAAWNAGRIQFLACHPASAGHGLNFQEGGAAHLCWFSPIWDLELWDQFIRRLRRSGNTAEKVIRHTLVVAHSIDELKLQALADKDMSQTRLKQALATVFNGETINPRTNDMIMKLQRAGAAAPAAEGERRAPAGWGAPKTEAAPAAQQTAAPAAETRAAPAGWGKPAAAVQEQRAEIQEKLNPQPETEAAAGPAETGAFSRVIADMKEAIEGTASEPNGAGNDPLPEAQQEPAKTTRTRAPASVTVAEGAVKLLMPVTVEQHAPPADEELITLQKLELLTRSFSNVASAMANGMPEDIGLPLIAVLTTLIPNPE
jgi:hypothetical protein